MRQTSASSNAAADDPAYPADSAGATANHVTDHPAAPVVMLPCAIATDSALGCAMAQTFAAAGWDICVYFDVRRPGERADAEHCCARVASFGRQAVALPVDIPGLGHSNGASALLARCADVGEGLGRLPRCLVNAPAEIDSEAVAATPMRIADGDVAPNTDGSILLRLTEVNVAPTLALSQAFHRAWMTTGEAAQKETPNLAIVNMIDSGTTGRGGAAVDRVDVTGHLPDRLAFELTQASVRAATPLLAKAFAPRVRVTGVSTCLALASASGHDAAQAAGHHAIKGALTDAPNVDTEEAATDAVHTFELTAAVCQAVLYLADAGTITGSILLADGGAHVHRAALAARPPVSQAPNASAGRAAGGQSVASTSDTVPEIASDPHDD